MITLDENHIYRDDTGVQVPGVTSILKDAGLIDMTWYDERARLRGELVHKACALYDNNDLDESSLDPELEPYVQAWIAFREESGFIPVLIEHIVSDLRYGYAGTLDITGRMNGADWLIDRKTGSAQPWSALQTAAYENCFEIPYRRGIIELDSEGKYRLIEHKDRNDIKVFLAALAIVNWKHNQGVK